MRYGVVPAGGAPRPEYRPEVLQGRDYLSAVPAEVEPAFRAAIDETRQQHAEKVIPFRSMHPPYPPRLLRCAPGRRHGEVMVTVYDPTRPALRSRERTNERTSMSDARR